MHKCLDRAVMSYSYLTRSTSAVSLPKCTFSSATTRRKISQICDNSDKLHLLHDVFGRYANFGCDAVAAGCWVVGFKITRYNYCLKGCSLIVCSRIRVPRRPRSRGAALSQSLS